MNKIVKRRHKLILKMAKLCKYPIVYSNKYWKKTAAIYAINNRYFIKVED